MTTNPFRSRSLRRNRRNRRPATRPDVFDGVTTFDGWPGQLLEDLARHADRLAVPAGTIVARRGQVANELVVVVDGWLHVDVADAAAPRLGPGTAVAPELVVEHGFHASTIVAATAVDVLVVWGPAFRAAVRQAPELVAGPPTTATAGPERQRVPTGDREPALTR